MKPQKKMRPIHPGEVLREDFLAPLQITLHALAIAPRVPASRMNDIVLERRGLTVHSRKMSEERNQKDASDRGERTPNLLVTATIVVICVAAYFLFDWFVDLIFEGLPHAFQNLLIFVGVMLILVDWLRRGVNWIERDWEQIQKEKKAALERDLKNQTGNVQISEIKDAER